MELLRICKTWDYYEINYQNKVRYKGGYKSPRSSSQRSHYWIAVFHFYDSAAGRPVIGFNKKLHTRPGQKVNYLNALSGPFDKVSRERDLSPASYYGAETNADARGEKHSLVRKIFRFRVAQTADWLQKLLVLHSRAPHSSFVSEVITLEDWGYIS